ncbi:MAG TPA: hypothetical protein VLB82_11840 [Thermodesulfobacteriota bacterium]|nr:hypothetical protein [Thermodesulfobacteriota bacterium]
MKLVFLNGLLQTEKEDYEFDRFGRVQFKYTARHPSNVTIIDIPDKCTVKNDKLAAGQSTLDLRY